MFFEKKIAPVVMTGLAAAAIAALSYAAYSGRTGAAREGNGVARATQMDAGGHGMSRAASSRPALIAQAGLQRGKVPSTENLVFNEPSYRKAMNASQLMPSQPRVAKEFTDYDNAGSRVNMLARPSLKARAKAGAEAQAAAACDQNTFASSTGSQLVSAVKSADTSCINNLFNVTGANQYHIFKESQMVTIANALRTSALSYNGTNSDSTLQLVLFLRAGYYIQYYNPSVVGTYGQAMKDAIRGALDAYFNNSNFGLVNNVHGEILTEAVILIDSSAENARYLYVVKSLLSRYNDSFNAHWYMKSAVNSTFTVLFRGHYNADFKALVQSDSSIIDSVYAFANNNFNRLGTDVDYMVVNAGGELGRFLQYTGATKSLASSRTKAIADRSSLTGVTAPMWVRVGGQVDYWDKANCAYYNMCDYSARVEAAALPISHTCSPTLKIRAQSMSTSELNWTCNRVAGQETYFHNKLATGNRPVANDNNAALEMVVFNSSRDYGTYAGAIFGIDTNNGGMYLEGTPSTVGNQARFIAYEAEWMLPTFDIWNLTHEYIHYLDGRFDMYGDFSASTAKKTIWWIEGFAEYMSYSYRNLEYTDAVAEARKGTYALSTIFQNDYNSGQTRIYNWGYLAVRYMFEKRASQVTSILGYFRPGNYTGYETFMNGIGTQYDADFRSFLTCVGTPTSPGCGGSGNQLPVAGFNVTTSGLSATFTDTSTDADGTIASRSWNFGDGTTSTAANPSKTYAAAGTYTVTLTVTDNSGGTNTTSRSVTVSGGSTLPTCPSTRTDEMGKNCSRSNIAATQGNYAYFFIYIPVGTTQLKITSSGGTGNADLYYSPSSWATTGNYTQRSINAGNSEALTVSNPASGYRYITLHAASAFSGVKLTTEY